MNYISGRIPNANRCRSLPYVALASVWWLPFLVPSLRTAKADSRQYTVVGRLDAKSARPTAAEITVRIGDVSVPATTIKTNPEVPRSIAIVLDAGPDQTNALAREKELAIALINEFSNGSTMFTITTAGAPSEPQSTLERNVATQRVRDVAGASGVKTNVPIYDPIASAIRLISRSPGLRIVVFIGEGNDGGSIVHYPELRSLAESNHIAFFAALVADHSLRGAKSILRYGSNLRELADDTAGVFQENEKTPKATRQLTESIRSLSLFSFDLPLLQPGRYKVSVSQREQRRLHSQKAVTIP
jgi:hypothetical protein